MDATSKIPILVSALVCPGAGQFLQKRWLSGAFFMTGFLAGFIWVMFVSLRIIAAYYAMAFDIDAQTSENTGFGAFIGPLLLALSFYILNLFDMASQNNRIAREKREEAFMQSMVSMMEVRADQKKQPPPIPLNETSD